MCRKLSGLIAVLMLWGAIFTACSSTESSGVSQPNNTAEEESTEAETTAEPAVELPRFDYEGYEFLVVTRADGGTGSRTWDVMDIEAVEQNGDLINDAVYKRNLKVEEKYNVAVRANKVESGTINGLINNTVLAGDDVYGAACHIIESAAALMLTGVLVDLNEVQYIDLKQPWWAQSITQDMSLCGRVYFATGDICLNDDKASWCILYNKKIAADLNLPDFYQIVRDGDWTLEALYKYASQGAKDLNGDGQMTFADDQWGIYDQLECAASLFLSSGMKAVESVGADGYKYNLDTEEAYKIFDNIYNLMMDKSFQFLIDTYTIADTWNTVRANYRADKALFFFTNIGALTMIRDMETDYGVLPVTKMYESQDRYYNTFQYNNASAYAIPVSASDPDRNAIIIESLAMGSPDTLTVAYYDMTLQQKAVRDNESIEMLKLIFDSRIFDFSLAFSNIGTMTFLKDQAKSKSNTFASAEASKHESFIKNIETVITTINELE